MFLDIISSMWLSLKKNNPANKKEKDHLTVFRRKFYANSTNVSGDHTGHLSVQTEKVYAHPPHKQGTVYVPGLP